MLFRSTFERTLKSTNQRHEVIALPITDVRDRDLPDVGIAMLHDPESDESFEVDTADPRVRDAWAQWHDRRMEALMNDFRRSRIGAFELQTGRPYAHRLRAFFDRHSRRRIA